MDIIIQIVSATNTAMEIFYYFQHKYFQYTAMEIFYCFQHKYFSPESHFLSLAILLLGPRFPKQFPFCFNSPPQVSHQVVQKTFALRWKESLTLQSQAQQEVLNDGEWNTSYFFNSLAQSCYRVRHNRRSWTRVYEIRLISLIRLRDHKRNWSLFIGLKHLIFSQLNFMF